MNTQDYKSLFEQSSSITLVIDRDFTIVDASNQYLKITKTVRKNIVGKNIFDVFPDHPSGIDAQGQSKMLASFNRVLKSKQSDVLPVVKKDISKQKSKTDESGVQYWRLCHSPVLDEFKKVKYIIQRVEDATETSVLATQLEAEQITIKKIQDSEKRYNMMLMESPFPFAVIKGKNKVITLANNRVKKILGKGMNIEGKMLLEIMPELKNTPFPGLINQVMTTGIPYHDNEVQSTKNNNGQLKDRYFNFVFQPYLEADETISGVSIIGYEVTSQVLVKKALEKQHEVEQKAMKKIEESNKRYYTMLMDSPFAFSIMLGKKMVITLANNLMKEFWGKGNNVEGKTLLEVLPELTKQQFPSIIIGVFTTGIPYYANEILASLEHNGQLEDRYFNLVFQPHYEADGTISGVITIAYEVTELVYGRKVAEESEHRYRTLVEEASVATGLYLGPDLRIQYANKVMLSYWGKNKSIIGKPMIEGIPELEGQPFIPYLKDVYTTGKTYIGIKEKADLLINGKLKTFYFNFTFKALRNKQGVIYGIHHMATDVTNEVLANKILEESEKRYHNLIYSSPSAIGILEGKEFVITNANDALLEIWGKGKNIIGKKFFEVLPELKEQGFMEIYNGIYDTGEPFIAIETGVNILRNKKNNLSYYNFILQPQRNAGGEIIGIGIIATEVKQVALLNKKIQVSEERFRMLIMQAPIAICVLRSKEYIIETINERMVEMWGRTMEESVNKPVFDVLIEVKNQGFRELLDNVYTTGERFVAEELPISLNRNGKLEIAFVKFIYEPLREADGTITGIMALAHEITDQVISRKKMEATALLHEEMLMTSPGFICTLVGPDHVYGLINEQYQKLFGTRKIKGKPLMIALPELEGQGLDTILDNVYKTGETFVGIDVPIMLAREENAVLELRYFNFSYQPMYDENKQIYSILVFGYEVTQQEIAKNRIEQSEKQFRLVTDAMPQKITTSDHEGNITFFNHQWINETGYALEELQNGGWQKTIHPDDIQITKNSWVNAIKFETAFEVECRILHKKWGYRWNLSRAVPIKDDNGKVIMWVGTHTDIHDHKEAKSKAESAVLIAEEAVKAKQQFLSNMSHEIRTPMNSIIGFTNVVLKTNLTDKQKEYINAVKVSGESLVVLIDDILDLAKVDAGKMIFEHTPFYLFSSVSDMLHLFETKIQEKNLTLIKQYDTSIPPVVVGDALRLRQIILNLVNNAVKFTTKGTITISIRKRTEDSENVTVEFIVKDTGMGIEEKNLDQIFNSFQQVAFETNRLYGGTGLGLAIVKQLVSLQGGTVKVKSKLGEGSTFSFTLNFKKIKAKFIKENNKTDASVKKEIASPEYLHKVKILAVEDIDLNQLLIKIMVTDFGFDIDIAANGKIALEYLAKNKYDLILMDLLMPVMNGFEATEMIRKKMKSKIPIIALTADVTTVDLKKCKALGMNDYISKPINEKELLTKITKYLKKSTKKKGLA